jgi:hypothetical protein
MKRRGVPAKSDYTVYANQVRTLSRSFPLTVPCEFLPVINGSVGGFVGTVVELVYKLGN